MTPKAWKAYLLRIQVGLRAARPADPPSQDPPATCEPQRPAEGRRWLRNPHHPTYGVKSEGMEMGAEVWERGDIRVLSSVSEGEKGGLLWHVSISARMGDPAVERVVAALLDFDMGYSNLMSGAKKGGPRGAIVHAFRPIPGTGGD